MSSAPLASLRRRAHVIARVTALAVAVARPVPASGDVTARLAARVSQSMAEAVVPGVQIAVIRNGSPVWHGAFGVANASTGAPVTEASVFEAASLTKPLFAYAVLQLVDEGRLDLDTPLVTYLPGRYELESEDLLKAVTARHVMSHRTGFPNWRRRDRPLEIHFPPGERFSYSGEGFVYLAAVVERLTGETVEAFVRRRVFDPLGMTSSSLVWQARYEPLEVFGHGIVGNVTGRTMPWRPNAAASLLTTARDYARFVAAAIAGVGLRPETAGQMLSPQARLDEGGFNTATVPPTGRLVSSLAWGLGWGLEEDAGNWSVWHWGDNGPVKAFVAASPRQRSGLVVFMNSENGLTMVPAVIREWRGRPSPALAWLGIEEPVPWLAGFVRTLREQGASKAVEEHRASRRGDAAHAALDEETVNGIGYALLRDRKVQDAVKVFELNAEEHPESWNALDSLGEALVASGESARAIRAYERSVELNPANAGGIEALKQLRSGAGERP